MHFAQIPHEWVAPLASGGIASIFAGWLMVRSDARMRGIENALNRQTRAMLLLVLSLSHNDTEKKEARSVLSEVDDSERGRS